MIEPQKNQGDKARNYGMFDAELSGAVLNLQLLRRLFKWLSPYKWQLFASGVLVLLTSFFAVMLPIPGKSCNNKAA